MDVNKESVLKLLQSVNASGYIGKADIDIVSYAVTKELLQGTQTGNFELSIKGRQLIDGVTNWQNISE